MNRRNLLIGAVSVPAFATLPAVASQPERGALPDPDTDWLINGVVRNPYELAEDLFSTNLGFGGFQPHTEMIPKYVQDVGRDYYLSIRVLDDRWCEKTGNRCILPTDPDIIHLDPPYYGSIAAAYVVRDFNPEYEFSNNMKLPSYKFNPTYTSHEDHLKIFNSMRRVVDSLNDSADVSMTPAIRKGWRPGLPHKAPKRRMK